MIAGVLFALLFLAIPIALIAGVVAAVMAVRRRDDDGDEAEPGIGTVRRLFYYGIAFLALVFIGVGLAMLIGGVLDAAFGDLLIEASDTQLAIALAFTVVGAPAWLIFALLAQRSVQQHEVERRSQARRLYLSLARGLALSIVMVAATSIGFFLVGVDDFNGDPWGWFLAWGGIWIVHDRLAASEVPPTRTTRLLDRLYLYYASVISLGTLISGTVGALYLPLSSAYDRLFREELVSRAWTEDLRSALVLVVVGGVVWSWHWLRRLARRDAGTTLWYTYLFIAGVAAAVAMTVGSLGTLLYAVLQWFFGDPGSDTAADHFASAPAMISLIVVGGLSWGYHRAVLEEGSPEERWSEPERIYRYLVAAAGLLSLAAGGVALIGGTLDALAPRAGELLRTTDEWRNAIVLGVTLVVVGAPLWARYWSQVQHEVDIRGDVERSALPRRIFVFAVFGLAALVVLINLTIVLYQLFEGVLEGSLSSEFLRDTRYSIALVLVAGAVAMQYWLVLREDQRATPESAPTAAVVRRPREVTVLAPAGIEDVLRELALIDGVRLRNWRRLDAPSATLGEQQLAALRERLGTAEGDRFVLILGDDRFDLVPYEVV